MSDNIKYVVVLTPTQASDPKILAAFPESQYEVIVSKPLPLFSEEEQNGQ